jgi:hypothetical protein
VVALALRAILGFDLSVGLDLSPDSDLSAHSPPDMKKGPKGPFTTRLSRRDE